MTLKTTLLASVALCGLMAAPALAKGGAPNIHLAAPHGVQAVHVKNGVSPSYHQNTTNFTETVTFSAVLSISTYFKQKIDLLGETWYNESSCAQPTKQKWKKLPKKTKYAKVGTATSTGTIGGCGSTIFTFQDITYDLISKKAKAGKTDKVSGDLVAKKFEGYNLTLVAHVDITFST
jgi:hypothetical protein